MRESAGTHYPYGQVPCASHRLRRPLLGLLIAMAAVVWPLAAPQPRSFDLLTASIAEVQAPVEVGGMTYERLVQVHRSHRRVGQGRARTECSHRDQPAGPGDRTGT